MASLRKFVTRPAFRTAWTWIGAPFLVLWFTLRGVGLQPHGLAGLILAFVHGHFLSWLQYEPKLDVLMDLLLIGAWVFVFIRTRKLGEHPETLTGLIRFWSEFRSLNVPANDISHEGTSWTITVPPNPATGNIPLAGDTFPGILVTRPPRCPKCGFGLSELPFSGGYYWTCTTCNLRHLNRRSIIESAREIERLARSAWEMSAE